MEKELENLRKAMDASTHKGIRFTHIHKEKIRESLRHEAKETKTKPAIHYYFVAALAISLFILLFSQDLAGHLSSEYKSQPASDQTIQDKTTKPKIDIVEAGSNTFVIAYGGQNMDRGNYDFVSIDGERKAVLEKTTDVKRGDIIYFNYPEDDGLPLYNPDDYLARVVGLPGETVEIIDGQVFINGKKLVAFYAKAARVGLDMKSYFAKVNDQSNLKEEDFKVNMPPVKVPDSAVFVLSDDWIRGTGSHNFGPVEKSEIKGKVLGYLKD
ncbi:signal peptidase I [Bacillus sp. B-jedd]|uniref:signal peptidase I n=1 Tax=Bacillus sp. B-jedd TaxID=1476857 RepID=UPI00051571BB|nr:signal peptidase I [Bacillus sp. B-jedd]CEG26246.1 signal peptidase I S [Bacillus sp. B-jedd]